MAADIAYQRSIFRQLQILNFRQFCSQHGVSKKIQTFPAQSNKAIAASWR